MRAFLMDAACWVIACAVGTALTVAFHSAMAFLSEAIEQWGKPK
jgi:hypothetical protein